MSIQVVKLTVSVPAELVKLADKVAKEKKISRSKVVSSCLQELAKQRFQADLEEGYKAMAK
jgi:metal-responsive CopG/Arc/MetJ family transcriptional regulator